MNNFENLEKKEPPSIELERTTLEDIQILLEIEKSTAGQKTYSGYFEEGEIKEYISNDTVYLIKNNEETVGSISYEVKGPEHAYISGLVIKPEFQGRGLAKQAMIKLLEELKNFKIVDLVVHPENERAVELYRSLGFIEKARKENFYGDGEPRIVMVKD